MQQRWRRKITEPNVPLIYNNSNIYAHAPTAQTISTADQKRQRIYQMALNGFTAAIIFFFFCFGIRLCSNNICGQRLVKQWVAIRIYNGQTHTHVLVHTRADTYHGVVTKNNGHSRNQKRERERKIVSERRMEWVEQKEWQKTRI